jgi:hypothetical protein
MSQWEELNDFSAYNKRVPCPLCKGESEPTLVGGHFKCSCESHLFNEDGSKLDVDCFCDHCNPEKALDVPMSKDLEKKVSKRKKKK